MLTDNPQSVIAEKVILGISLLGSAYLMAAATGPYGQPLAAWLALFPLFVSICVLPAWLAGIAGGLWGAGVYFFAASGLLWLPHPGTTPGLETFLLIAGAPAVYAGLAAWLTQRIGFSPFVLGVGWLAVELALARLNLNVGLLGPAQPDDNFLHWLAHALGSVFVGFIIAYVSALCVCGATRIPRGVAGRTQLAGAECYIGWNESESFFYSTWRFILSCRPRAPPWPDLTMEML